MVLHTSRDRYYRRNITWISIKNYVWRPLLATPYKTAKTKSSDGSVAWRYSSGSYYSMAGASASSSTYQVVCDYLQTPKYAIRLFSLDPKK